jgi:FtsP/CotA-like multicopper oxidase with cupredoxin domain
MLSPDKFTKWLYANGNDSLDQILINGRGLQVNTIDPPQVPLSEFKVKHGLKYRFRVIHAGSFTCPMEVSVDDHSLLMIATDGTPIVPVKVKSFVVFTGYII